MQVNNSQMRFAGLISGLDTESLVKELMNAERTPLVKLLQKKQLLEWQRDSYRDVNKLLKDFDTFIFDGIFRQSTFMKKTVSSSNENAVTARAINSSANVSVQIQVEQLATSEVWVSGGDIAYTAGEARTLTFHVTKPGQTEATEVTVEIGENDTLDDVIRKLNRSGLGVTVFYDEFNKNLVMTMNETGAGAKIELADQDTIDFMTNELKFTANGNVLQSIEGSGKNAKFTINGYATERTSNVFTINGIEYTLKNVTDNPVTITTATDVDSIVDAVVQFVNEYNKLIDQLHAKITEPRYRNFPPLTDEQKEEMSEKQIELWEEKAKSGLLRNDTIISNGLNQMRLDIYTPVELADGTKLYLADFGITAVKDYSQRGKLVIDEDKLREKIAEDPMKLYELFNSTGANSDHASMGIAQRLRATTKQVTLRIEERAGNSTRTNQQFVLGRNIIDIDKQIERMQERLKKIEERYWRQFTAMEQAIQRANMQSMFLFEQFGGY